MAQTSFYSVNFIGWPPVHLSQYANPNSSYWRERCLSCVERFDDRAPQFLTKAEWEWLNGLASAHLGEDGSWRAYYEAYHLMLEAMLRQPQAADEPGVTAQAIAYAAGVLPEGPCSETESIVVTNVYPPERAK